ncbi:MAG: hypothetical protein Q8876_09505 [Bacillota bacterium]|nr:hypothetical protein [Bacillota bacterium]
MIPPGYIDNKINCGTGSGIAVENDEVSDKTKVKKKIRSFFNVWKENKEIVDYVTRIYENNDPFERTWIASYELPYFVSCRINKSNHYDEAKRKAVNKKINLWCAFVIKHLD